MSTEEIRATNQWTERLTDIRPAGITRFLFRLLCGDIALGASSMDIVVS